MEDLVQGQDFAKQLQILLQTQNSLEDHHPMLASVVDLVSKIQQSISNGISKLNSCENDEVCQSPAITQVGSPCSDDRKTENSGVIRKSAALKDRKVGLKRRKTLHTWVNVTATPIDDGRAWRKYGQKEILNAKHPRSYFRCTHKNDQGCQATKQVQRTEEEPSMYRTTYIGHHTCKDSLKAPQLILDSSPQDTYLLNFQSNFTTKQDSPFSPFPSTKQEFKRELAKLNHNDSSQSSDFLDLYDLTDIDPSRPTSMLARSTAESEHGDVISSVYSCATSDDQSFDMDAIVRSVDFGDDGGFFDDLLKY